MALFLFITCFLYYVVSSVEAFHVPINSIVDRSISVVVTTHSPSSSTALHATATRRTFVQDVVRTTSTIVLGGCSSSLILLLQNTNNNNNIINVEVANASGGATAGGVYLLSAKQRYNSRVTSAVITFVAIGTQLEKGDIDSVRNFFTNEDVGSWKDFTASGYLLANAFRRSSNTPPDSLPSVKKWKAFTAEVENMTKALKKKDTKEALAAHGKAITALDEYLVQVELPVSKEVSSVA